MWESLKLLYHGLMPLSTINYLLVYCDSLMLCTKERKARKANTQVTIEVKPKQSIVRQMPNEWHGATKSSRVGIDGVGTGWTGWRVSIMWILIILVMLDIIRSGVRSRSWRRRPRRLINRSRSWCNSRIWNMMSRRFLGKEMRDDSKQMRRGRKNRERAKN